VEPVAERVADHLVGHHPCVPCTRQAQEDAGTSRGLVHGLHVQGWHGGLTRAPTKSTPKEGRGPGGAWGMAAVATVLPANRLTAMIGQGFSVPQGLARVARCVTESIHGRWHVTSDAEGTGTKGQGSDCRTTARRHHPRRRVS
jgi:hypothetical protein